MEFHQLRYFVAAAETGSMSKAAAREHVSQPALSRQVAKLEQRLSVQLFERARQRIHLSEAGRAFLPRARQLLCDAETAAQQLRERFGAERRTLRIGFVAPFLDDLVAPTVRALRQARRGLKVALFDLAPRAQLDRLGGGELDAAILANLDDEHRRAFRVRRLSRHRFAAALPEGHALAGARTVDLAALRGEAWVSLDEALFPGRERFLRDACEQAGFEPDVRARCDSVAMMLGGVAAGDGVALVPRHAAKLPHDGSVFVALRAPVPFVELALVTRRGDASDELELLHDLLRARAAALRDA